MDVVKVIQMLVAPVVMISACGLLCLAFYNRLAVIVSRIRTFNHERLELLERLGATATGTSCDGMRERLEVVDRQVVEILKRARLVRSTLVCLVGCILCMVFCSLLLGLSLLLNTDMMQAAGLAVFVIGMLGLLVGMVLALLELSRALAPVALDRDFMLRLIDENDVHERQGV